MFRRGHEGRRRPRPPLAPRSASTAAAVDDGEIDRRRQRADQRSSPSRSSDFACRIDADLGLAVGDQFDAAVERRAMDTSCLPSPRRCRAPRITLPICVPLGVLPGVAWTMTRAASIASRNFSFVEMVGLGAPALTTALMPTMPNMACVWRARRRPWRSHRATGIGITSTSAFSPAASCSRSATSPRRRNDLVAGLPLELRRQHAKISLRRAAAE